MSTKRAFANEADFNAWHENAKNAAGLPVVGANAATGAPQPNKQQTTEYTGLGRDDDGKVILEAVVADERLAQRGLAGKLIREGLLEPTEVRDIMSAYNGWNERTTYKIGDLRVYNGELYKCVEEHVGRTDRVPPEYSRGWERVT